MGDISASWARVFRSSFVMRDGSGRDGHTWAMAAARALAVGLVSVICASSAGFREHLDDLIEAWALPPLDFIGGFARA